MVTQNQRARNLRSQKKNAALLLCCGKEKSNSLSLSVASRCECVPYSGQEGERNKNENKEKGNNKVGRLTAQTAAKNQKKLNQSKTNEMTEGTKNAVNREYKNEVGASWMQS